MKDKNGVSCPKYAAIADLQRRLRLNPEPSTSNHYNEHPLLETSELMAGSVIIDLVHSKKARLEEGSRQIQSRSALSAITKAAW